jgi:copper chaperone CopZ
MTTTAYPVTGMTCEHCSRAVTGELAKLRSVTKVTVNLVPGGASQVTVTSDTPLPDRAIIEALGTAAPTQQVITICQIATATPGV